MLEEENLARTSTAVLLVVAVSATTLYIFPNHGIQSSSSMPTFRQSPGNKTYFREEERQFASAEHHIPKDTFHAGILLSQPQVQTLYSVLNHHET